MIFIAMIIVWARFFLTYSSLMATFIIFFLGREKGSIQGFEVFQEGKEGSDCSESNGENIANLSECKLAAAKLEKEFKSTEYDPLFPKGCYAYVNRGNASVVYWNEHNEGSKHRKASPLCIVISQGNVLHNW